MVAYEVVGSLLTRAFANIASSSEERAVLYWKEMEMSVNEFFDSCDSCDSCDSSLDIPLKRSFAN